MFGNIDGEYLICGHLMVQKPFLQTSVLPKYGSSVHENELGDCASFASQTAFLFLFQVCMRDRSRKLGGSSCVECCTGVSFLCLGSERRRRATLEFCHFMTMRPRLLPHIKQTPDRPFRASAAHIRDHRVRLRSDTATYCVIRSA